VQKIKTSQLKKNGFTIPELIISMTIFGILIGFIAINLIGLQRRTSLTTIVDTLVTDMKNQQTKAMIGDTEGRSVPDNYGIYIGNDRYILFHGNSYVPNDPANFIIELDGNQEFTDILVPQSTILFASRSGEMVGFIPGSNSFTIQDSENGIQKTIFVNRYGIITGIN
jgi:prepilin-type N-terminal cleavage/methylation domain-containing protein